MRDPAARRFPPARAVACLTWLILALPGSSLPAARADDTPERLTPEQRQELERRTAELHEAGLQCYQRGDLVTAVDKVRQSLQLFELLYPKERYPQGHPDLANSLDNLGVLLRDQGDYGGARGYLERALAMR